jgi:hypothetical protein
VPPLLLPRGQAPIDLQQGLTAPWCPVRYTVSDTNTLNQIAVIDSSKSFSRHCTALERNSARTPHRGRVGIVPSYVTLRAWGIRTQEGLMPVTENVVAMHRSGVDVLRSTPRRRSWLRSRERPAKCRWPILRRICCSKRSISSQPGSGKPDGRGSVERIPAKDGPGTVCLAASRRRSRFKRSLRHK